VDGEEVVGDSRRILQYLEWRYEEDETPASASASSGSV
jgi:hypothetical protein